MSNINYPVGDFITRVKNATLANLNSVSVPKTKLIKAVSETLKKEGFVDKINDEKGKFSITISFKNKKPILMNLKVVSRPGLRIYADVDTLEKKRGPSIYILSTPKGVMSSRQAKKLRLGGEVIAEVW